MKILLLSDLYPPIIGGLERHVQTLARALADRGHRVSVVTLWHEGLPELAFDRGVEIHRVRGLAQRIPGAFEDPARRYAPPVPDPGVLAALDRLVRRTRPDVVHAHNWLVHSFLPLKRAAGPRLVLSLHDYSLVCAKKSLMYRGGVCSGPAPAKCLRCAAGHYGTGKGMVIATANAAMTVVEQRLVDLFVPVSQAVADGNRLERQGLPYEVIPNFVPDDVAATAADPTGIASTLPEDFFLFVGALGRHKGIHVLLDAHGRLGGAPPLVLVGSSWPDTPETFPPNVHVLRDVGHPAVMAIMARSLALVVPSIYPDACPTVAMEAMATQRPVIASRIGGLPELVDHERTGLLVRPGEPEALATAMAHLAADAHVRREMGEAGMEKGKAFTVGHVVGRLEEAYERVVRNAPARARG